MLSENYVPLPQSTYFVIAPKLLIFVVKFVLDSRMIHLYLGGPMARYLNGDLGSIPSQDPLYIILMFRFFRLSNKAKTKSFRLIPSYLKGVC